MEGKNSINPYRTCCLNCVFYTDGYCCRIPGVQVLRQKPRRMIRCGYFENKNKR